MYTNADNEIFYILLEIKMSGYMRFISHIIFNLNLQKQTWL